jgi:hypothetical protein
MFPGITKANTPTALPETKQTKLNTVLDILDELRKQELKKSSPRRPSGKGCGRE